MSSSSPWWKNWEESHRRCCLSRGSLVATPQLVQEFTFRHRPHGSDNVLWDMPESHSVFEWNYRALPMHLINDDDSNDSSATVQQVTRHLLEEQSSNDAVIFTSFPPSSPEPAATVTKETPSSSSIMATPTKALWKATTTLLSPLLPWFRDDDDDNDAWVHQDDDAAKNSGENCFDDVSFQQQQDPATTSNPGFVPWNQPILCKPLTRACVDYMRDSVTVFLRQEQSSHHGAGSSGCFPLVLSRFACPHPTSSRPPESCWTELVRKRLLKGVQDAQATAHAADATVLLSQISADQTDFLLQCLVTLGGNVRLIPAATNTGGIPREDLVVIGPLTFLEGNLDEENKSLPELAHQVVASWWELSCAQSALEQQRLEWSQQAERYYQQAGNKNKNIKTRTRLLQLHRLVQQRLTDSEASIWNLDKAQHALEESVTQRQVVQALQSSTLAFQSLRQAVGSVDNVEELLESFQGDTEDNEVFHERLASATMNDEPLGVSPKNDGTDVEEEDLMRELEKLMISDNKPTKEVHLPKAPTTALPQLKEGASNLNSNSETSNAKEVPISG